MINYTQIVGKTLSFISNLSTGKLALILFFGIMIAVTWKPEVWEITLDYLAKVSLGKQ